MVVDSSAMFAILLKEPGWEPLATALVTARAASMSASTYVECSMVAERVGLAAGWKLLDELIERARIEIISFDTTQALIACDAFRRFGKGRHPAGLNLGDCFSYALAKHRNEPLLFKGTDFQQTDIAPAI